MEVQGVSVCGLLNHIRGAMPMPDSRRLHRLDVAPSQLTQGPWSCDDDINVKIRHFGRSSSWNVDVGVASSPVMDIRGSPSMSWPHSDYSNHSKPSVQVCKRHLRADDARNTAAIDLLPTCTVRAEHESPSHQERKQLD